MTLRIPLSILLELYNIHVAFSYVKLTIQVMRSLGHSNLAGCQVALADRTMIHTCGVYTISVNLGLSLGWLSADVDRLVILTCGVMLIQW